MKSIYLLSLVGLLWSCTSSPQLPVEQTTFPQCKTLHTELGSSIRGMIADAQQRLWLSGSKGKVWMLDAQKQLQDVSPAGYESLDFRAIASPSPDQLIVVSAGSPAIILRSTDGGKQWTQVYADSSEAAFYNVIGFWNEREGVVFGDPINGRFTMLLTQDGGEHWAQADSLHCPQALKGEAGFAASGTNMRLTGDSHLYYLTGGARSQMLFSADKGENWLEFSLPIRQGKESEGGYSFDISATHIVVAGGDYSEPNAGEKGSCVSADGGLTWQLPQTGMNGYRSCVHHIDGSEWIAVGSNGIDFSSDNGQNWSALDTTYNLNVVTFVQPSIGYAAGKDVLIEIVNKK